MTDKPEIISLGMTMNDLRWSASNHSDEDREWLEKNHGRVQFDTPPLIQSKSFLRNIPFIDPEKLEDKDEVILTVMVYNPDMSVEEYWTPLHFEGTIYLEEWNVDHVEPH